MATRDEPKSCKEAKLCPFCGSVPEILYWHGGPRTKRRIHCVNEECAVQPGVTGPTKAAALANWNRRLDDPR